MTIRALALLSMLFFFSCNSPLPPEPTAEQSGVPSLTSQDSLLELSSDPNKKFHSGRLWPAWSVIGNSLPGNFRPFADDSPWNTPIPDNAEVHPESESIIKYCSRTSNIRFITTYNIPIWVVNSSEMDIRLPYPGESDHPSPPGDFQNEWYNCYPEVDSMQLHWKHIRSDIIFDFWDGDRDGWTDIPIPLAKAMWKEPTSDGHFVVVDPFKLIAWEMSKYNGWETDPPRCTTFNVWDLTGSGVGEPGEGSRWQARGGRGSGFPVIAGSIRPEEIANGVIRHKLVFTFGSNRDISGGEIMMWPPACRSDGSSYDESSPIEGMLFQLDPSLTEKDFIDMGLGWGARIVARAMQEYGMYLGDNGGDMAIGLQLLGEGTEENRAMWNSLFPGMYNQIKKIRTDMFRVIYTGEPTTKG